MSTPLTQPITEDDIANYLASTPDFFERHAELLAAEGRYAAMWALQQSAE